MNHPIPLSAKVSRVRVHKSFIAERHARRGYYALRDRYDAGEQERFLETLRLREVPPAGQRWSRSDLDVWLKQALANTPPLEESTGP